MPDTAIAEAPAKAATGGNILQVRNLEAWYGESHILHGINFDVNAGEVVTLLGRNGAGKTTTLKSIMGMIGKRTGSSEVQQPGHHPHDLRPDRADGHRVLSGRARNFRQPRRAGKSVAAAGGARRADCRSSRSSTCSRT